MPTIGGVISLTGTNFGPSAESATNVKVTYGGNVCAVEPANSGHTLIVCDVPAGTGAGYVVDVTVGPDTNTQAAEFAGAHTISYAGPAVSSVPQDISTRGARITLQGSNFGTNLADVRVFLDEQPLNVAGGDNTHIVVDIPAGTGLYYPLRVDIGPTGYDTNATFGVQTGISYGEPIIFQITPPEDETSGGVMTINGLNFGSSINTINIYIVGVGSCDVEIPPTQEQVICQVPPGTGAPYDLLISVGPIGNARNNTNATAFSYDAPSVFGVHGLPVPTTGGIISLVGNNFGASTSTAWITFGDSDEYSCEPQTVSKTLIICQVPAGTGNAFPLKVVVGPAADSVLRQNATQPGGPYTISYAAPTLSGVSDDVPTAGGLLSISGASFGTVKADVSVVFYPTSTPSGQSVNCPVSDVTDGIIVCSIPKGTGQTYYLFVSVGPALAEAHTQDTSYIIFHYAQPSVVGISGSPVPTSSGQLSIYGSNFGDAKLLIKATFSFESATVSCDVTDAGDSYFVCSTPLASGLSHTLAITVGPTSNEWTAAGVPTTFAYAAPTLTSVAPNPVSTSGGYITISGTNFGPYAADLQTVTFGTANTVCSVDGASSGDTAIVCNMPPGTGGDYPLTVTVGPHASSNTQVAGGLTISYTRKYWQ